MEMIRWIFALSFILSSASGIAQIEFSGSVKRYFNDEPLDDFRSLTTFFEKAYQADGFDVREVDNFPDQDRYGFDVNIHNFLIGNLILGYRYEYFSSGGKLHYADYSGEISDILKYNRKVTTLRVGYMLAELGADEESPFLRLQGIVNIGFVKSQFSYQSALTIYDQKRSTEGNLNADVTFFEPEFEIKINVILGIQLIASASYLTHSAAAFEDENDRFISINGKDKLELDLSGPRFSAGIGFHF